MSRAGDTGEVGRQEGFQHRPVLADEVTAALEPGPGKVFFDGTIGGGGHDELLLESGAQVIGCDRDPDALAHASRRLARFGNRFRPYRGAYAGMERILEAEGVDRVDGVLLDLGVSSWQLDAPSRGFSFLSDGPLDMRMDPRAEPSAATLVNEAPEAELADLFRTLGEERAARRIARAIVQDREAQPFESTRQLAELIERVQPRRGAKRHPATRVFQALRMAVNDELGQLEAGLAAASRRLLPGGVLAVISFHSLEDRVVKHFLRDRSRRWLDRPEWPEPRPNPDWWFEEKLPKPVAAGAEELAVNPRARSARLRVGRRRIEEGRAAS